MSRFSPTVVADYGPGLNVANLLEGYHRGQTYAHEREQQKLSDALQTMQLNKAGVHRGQAPLAPPPLQYTVKPGRFDPTLGTFAPATVVAGQNDPNAPLQPRAGVSQLTPDYYLDQTEADAYQRKEAQTRLADLLAEYEGKAGIEAAKYKGEKDYEYNLSAPERLLRQRKEQDDELQRAVENARADRQAEEMARHNRVTEGQGRFTVTPGVDPDTGKPTVFRVNTRTGDVSSTGVGRPQGTGSGMAGGAVAPVGDMEQRYAEIEAAARALGNKEWKIGRAMQAREGLAYGMANKSAEGKGVPVRSALEAGLMDLTGFGAGGKDYERYAALMNSTRAMGDDAAKVFKGRQNEAAVAREIALAQLTPDDYGNPQVVEQKLSRLRHVIELAKATMPATGEHAPSPGTSAGSHTITVNGKTFVVPE